MSRLDFTLRLPVDPPFQALARDVAWRFLEGLRADRAVCEGFSAAVGEAVADVSTGADAIDLSFSREPAGVAVTIAAGGRHRTVSHSL